MVSHSGLSVSKVTQNQTGTANGSHWREPALIWTWLLESDF